MNFAPDMNHFLNLAESYSPKLAAGQFIYQLLYLNVKNNKLPRRKQRGIRKASAVDPDVIFGNQFPDV